MRVIATAGHVDHGKSTLLRAITGMEPDRWEEERRRGLTIDLGFVWTRLTGSDGSKVTVAFVDVPGHERFVGNMLAGAGVAPAVLFVVAADDGWSAQSQEHLDILDLLQVAGTTVAVTKADLAGPERTSAVVADVRKRIHGTCLAAAPIMITDAVSGRGLDAFVTTLADEALGLPDPVDRGRARLWIDRTFSVAGAGTVVTGTLTGGSFRVGQRVRLLPAGKTARIRSLETLGDDVDAVGPGCRVGINLVGVHRDAAGRGSTIVTEDAEWIVTTAADIVLRVLPGRTIGSTGAWHVHAGSAQGSAAILPLLGDIPGGQDGFARLELTNGLPLQHGDRLVIRDAGRNETTAGGVVLDPGPPRRPRGTSERLIHAERLEQLAESMETCVLLASLLDAVGGASDRGGLLARAGLSELPACSALRVVDGHVVCTERLASWEAALVGEVGRQPAETGTAIDQLDEIAESVACPRHLVRPVIQMVTERGRLIQHRNVVVTPDQEASYVRAREARRVAYLRALDEDPLQPPDPDELARAIGMSASEVQALVDTGEVVRAGPVVFSQEAVDDAVARLRAHCSDPGGFTASQARATLGTTRKYLVPLLEHLATRGITTFDGTHHSLAEDP